VVADRGGGGGDLAELHEVVAELARWTSAPTSDQRASVPATRNDLAAPSTPEVMTALRSSAMGNSLAVITDNEQLPSPNPDHTHKFWMEFHRVPTSVGGAI
jgi:hypothetical protein